MAELDLTGDLHAYLRDAREILVWKLDGLGEHDARRPMTPTGTNLLGLVRHCGATHLRYFGAVFGRAEEPSLAWLTGGPEPGAEMWVGEAVGRAEVVDACRRAWAWADATIEELPLDAPGRVPWWGPEPVTLRRVLVHVTAETQRHAGHADVVRELLDGSAGLLEGHDDLRVGAGDERAAFCAEVEAAARRAAEVEPEAVAEAVEPS